MNISARLAKLERNESLTGQPTVLDRYQAELDSVALRLTGSRWQTIAADAPLANLLSENLKDFLRGLSDKDLAILKSELKRIEFVVILRRGTRRIGYGSVLSRVSRMALPAPDRAASARCGGSPNNANF